MEFEKIKGITCLQLWNQQFSGYLSSIYWVLIVHRGKVNEYFEVYLEYSKQGTLKLSMIKYVYSVLQEFPEYLGATTSTPAADHLFKVRNESETRYLIEDQAQNFHHTVAQLLFMSAREIVNLII